MGYIDSDGEYTGDKTLPGEGKAVSKSALNDKISHLLHNALTIMDEHGRGRPCVWEAQKKGIVFDVGHGGGSFLFEQAIPAMDQGFMPNAISTDLHTGSMNGGMKDMLNISSKFLNMGMSLQETVKRCTWDPALSINHEELGHLSVGAVADLAVLSLKEGDFGFMDTKGWKIQGTQKLECELTIREGKIVWDLNGISVPEWPTDN